LPSDFFLLEIGLHGPLPTTLPSDPNLRFRRVESELLAALMGGEAIRSVSHLVLALDEPMSN
jgi:hypothetical protein